MLRISQSQIDGIAAARRDDYRRQLVDHCRQCFPIVTSRITISDLVAAVTQAMERAEGLGFRRRGGTRLIVELSLLFGSDFIHDPLHPWAAQALDTPDVVTEQRRARRLHDAVHAYLRDFFHGAGNSPGMHSMLLRQTLQQESFRVPGDTWPDALVSRLEVYFPTHVTLAQPGAFRQLVQHIARQRDSLQLTRPDDIGHAVALQVGFGHHWYQDPALSWMHAALRSGGMPRLRQVALDQLTRLGEGGAI